MVLKRNLMKLCIMDIHLQINFNPEHSQASANGSYWEDGHWVETKPMEKLNEYDFTGW